MPTTAAAIRDRIYTVIEALTPLVLSNDKFRRYRDEGDGDFRAWAEANKDGNFRRFQVRSTGHDEPPAISNLDVERRFVTFEIVVAYPQTGRAGSPAATKRDDMMRSDFRQIDYAIGMCGRANFQSPHPDCTWDMGLGPAGVMETERADGIDFVVITNTYSFYQSTEPSDEVISNPFWITVDYTIDGTEANSGLDFYVPIGRTVPTPYRVDWAPAGVTNIPDVDLPNDPGDRTPSQFRVQLGAPLAVGDVISFLLVG